MDEGIIVTLTGKHAAQVQAWADRMGMSPEEAILHLVTKGSRYMEKAAEMEEFRRAFLEHWEVCGW